MIISAEISLYPLTENYKSIILNFLDNIKKTDGLKIETNGMSTQIFGEFDLVMGAITDEMKQIFENNKAVLILKMGKGEMRFKE